MLEYSGTGGVPAQRPAGGEISRAQLAVWLNVDQEALALLPDEAVEALVALLEASREVLPGKIEALRDDVRRLELLERLHRDLASRDPLTGVANRRGLDQRLSEEWERAVRYGHPLSAVSIDVDGLKYVNDNFGHHAGDAVIAAVAERLSSQVRATDFVARVGGDEFVVVCPEIGEQAAAIVAAKLAAACAATPVELPGGEVIPSVSAGWASADIAAGSPTLLLHEADQDMYRIKRSHSGTPGKSGPLEMSQEQD